jgi:hypothetical protein
MRQDTLVSASSGKNRDRSSRTANTVEHIKNEGTKLPSCLESAHLWKTKLKSAMFHFWAQSRMYRWPLRLADVRDAPGWSPSLSRLEEIRLPIFGEEAPESEHQKRRNRAAKSFRISNAYEKQSWKPECFSFGRNRGCSVGP